MSMLLKVFSAVSVPLAKLIPDKDKQIEFAFKTQELTFKLMEKMLDTPTNPWVDAIVKFAFAIDQIAGGLVKLFRPVGASAAFVFAAYCDVNSIELSPTVETILYGLLPAWGVSRHVEKAKKTSRAEYSSPFDD